MFKINRDIVDANNGFSFSNMKKIEKISLSETKKNIQNLYLDQNLSDEYKHMLINNIFNSLSIDHSNLSIEIERENAKKVIEAMNDNFFNNINNKRHKLFILSEIIVPLNLKKYHKNIEWVWWNQSFNYDGNPKIPARGLDCGMTYNSNFIFCEIKSSQSFSKYKQQIDKAINSFLDNDRNLNSIKKKVSHYISKERFELINFQSKKFIIGTLCWGFGKDITNLEIPEVLDNSSISLFEINVDGD